MESQTGWMLYLARFSPKNRRLSLAPRALALTLIPAADFCCARAMKVEASLESGPNSKELRTASTAANTITAIAAIRILRVREFFIASNRHRMSRMSDSQRRACHWRTVLDS